MISVSRLLIYAPGADSPSTAYPGVGLAGAGFQKPHIKSHGFSQCLTRFPGLWFGLLFKQPGITIAPIIGEYSVLAMIAW